MIPSLRNFKIPYLSDASALADNGNVSGGRSEHVFAGNEKNLYYLAANPLYRLIFRANGNDYLPFAGNVLSRCSVGFDAFFHPFIL